MSAGRLERWAAIAILGWGVSALGATRPWGYLPLLAGMALYGAASSLKCEEAACIGRGLRLSFLTLCTAVFLQLVPLPDNVIALFSPSMTIAGREFGSIDHPLSIDPGKTALGLAFLLALGLFFVGLVRTLQRDGVRRMAVGIVGLGVLVAVVGIAEVSTSWGGVYAAAALPLPPDSTPHGPFSSRNHYAGWMLMTFAMALAYVCAILEQPHRTKIGHLLCVPGAAIVMSIALVQTRSRAAILGLMLAVAVMCGLALRRRITRATRMLVSSLAAVLVVAALATTGMQPIMSRFATDTWSTAHGRLPIWRQAMVIARDFRMTGSGFNTYPRIVRFYPTDEIDQPYEGAHNDFLQLAVEGGLLVGLPAIAAVAFFIVETTRRIRESAGDAMTDWLRIGAVVGLVLLAAQETVDFTLQIPGNAALFVFLAAVAVHHAPSEKPSVTQRSSASEMKTA